MPDFSLRALIAAVCLVTGPVSADAQVGPSTATIVAPTGTLRAAFLETNPVQGRLDPRNGAVSGPAVDLTRELGKRLGVPVSVVGVAGMRAMVDGFMKHTLDMAFLAVDPTRATEVDFSQVYSLSWSSYIVLLNSPLHSTADVDQSGIRIGAASGDSPALYLSRNLKNAQLKPYPNPPAAEALRMLAAGEIDAYAANRQRLLEMAASAPNFGVLPDNYFAVRQAIIVAKGNRAALDVINMFLDDARTSGLIQLAIDRAKLTGAVDVAPVEKK